MIVGRKEELELLERFYDEEGSQFFTVYGRRRVGKTFLITEFFKQKDCFFLHATGLEEANMKEQLANFTRAMSKAFPQQSFIQPRNWREAFLSLTEKINYSNKKVVLFFDELQWMASSRSNLLNTIDFFWNNEWAGAGNVIFIACGSSASWLIGNIIQNKGGLHNRTDLEMQLSPFNLAETKEFLRMKGVTLNDDHILAIYMAMGGIPFYLKYVTAGRTAQQNIQKILFDKKGPLRGEYSRLFKSLFDKAEACEQIIEILSEKREGLNRAKIVPKATLSGKGGRLSKRLKELCEAEFIEKYTPMGENSIPYYKLIDEFCLFYLHWIKNYPGHKIGSDYWLEESQRSTYKSWAGYAFEAICTKHVDQITRTLGIKGARVITSWRCLAKSENESGAQIDLVLVRNDNAITLCEIKHTKEPFLINKSYAKNLNNKIDMFQKETNTKDQLFLAMISAKGVKKNMYSENLIDGIVILEDLFRQ